MMGWRAALVALFVLQAAGPAQAEILYIVTGAPGYNTTGPATSCAEANVAAAFAVITATTTAVQCGAGTWHWSTSLHDINLASGIGSFSFLGAGDITSTAKGGGDATVIIDDVVSDGNNGLVNIYQGDSSTTIVVRVAGFTFQHGTGVQKNHGFVKFDGGVVAKKRFDHNHTIANSVQTKGVHVHCANYGVYDHNLSDNAAIYISGTCNTLTAQLGDEAWAADTNLGSFNGWFYIEYNTHTSGGFNDCDHAGKFVIRYNLGADLQTHPTGGSGRARGCRAWEVYGNTGTGTGLDAFNFFFMSSGSGVVWNNTVAAGYSNFITMHSMFKNRDTYPEDPTPDGWGYCGTSSGLPGAGSKWNQNTDAVTGYACMDQPGRGKGDLLSGSFNAVAASGVQNSTRGCNSSQDCAWPRQALDPTYEWLNSSPVPVYAVAAAFTSVLANDRDYFTYTASFDGTSGVGKGLLSARPATCSSAKGGVTGADVAYWATDTSTLYRCTSPNTWTTYYVPAASTHPLNTAGDVPLRLGTALGGGITVGRGVTIR